MSVLLLTCLALTTTACADGERLPMQYGSGERPGEFRRAKGPDGGRDRGGGGMRGRLFVSPMGEPFRTDSDSDPEDAWFARADANHDGILTLAEFKADAARFFAVLDRGQDGEIDPDDIDYYETEVLPEVSVGGGGGFSGGGRGGRGGGRGGGGGHHGGGGRHGSVDTGAEGGDSSDSDGAEGSKVPQVDDSKLGAARYGFFDYPEPITPADTNYNRGISATEFQAAAEKRFAMLDKDGTGALRVKDLPRVWGASFNRPPGVEGPRPARDRQRPLRDDSE